MIERCIAVPELGTVQIRSTSVVDGTFAVDSTELAGRREAVAPHPWTWLHQVHGAGLVTVVEPGDGAGAEADASVTSCVEAALAVQTADCAAVVLLGQRAIGVAHAGWRGLVRGVVQATADAVRDAGSATDPFYAFVGPCIAVADYEFDPDALDDIAGQFGDSIRGCTAWGTPAFDLRSGVQSVLETLDIAEIDMVDSSTAEPSFFSHRVRGDRGRQTTVAWIERP